MDKVVAAAYLRCRDEFGASVDTLLCDPDQRAALVTAVRQSCTEAGEREILRCLVNLRKRSRLPTRNETNLD